LEVALESEGVAGGGVFAGLGEGDEGVEKLFDERQAGVFENGGDGFGGEGLFGLLEDGAEGLELVGESFGPGELLGFSHGRHSVGFGNGEVEGLLGADGGFLGRWVLEVGAEVADDSLLLFFVTLMIEGDEVGEDLVVGEGRRPAVGFEDGGVEVVVELFEDGNQTFVVNFLFLRGERRGRRPRERAPWALEGAEFFEDVVHVGECEVGVEGLLALAVGVERFGEVADFLF